MVDQISDFTDIGLPIIHVNCAYSFSRSAQTWTSEFERVLGPLSKPENDDGLQSVCAEWVQRWVDFREQFSFDNSTGAVDAFDQLRAAGLSKVAASIFRADPPTHQLNTVVRTGLLRAMSAACGRLPTSLAFLERDRHHGRIGSDLLRVIDVFHPKKEEQVSNQKRLEIVGEIRRLRSDWAKVTEADLTSSINEMWKQNEVDRQQRVVACREAVADMEDFLRIALAMKVQLRPFGSNVYGIFDANSDLDCLCVLDIVDPASAFSAVCAALGMEGSSWIILEAVQARASVITVKHKTEWVGLEIDLSFCGQFGQLSVENSSFFAKLISSDSRVAPLLYFLKQAFRRLALIRPKDGLFSSYSYITMALSVLTDLDIVPRLRQGFSQLEPRWVDGCNVAHNAIPLDWKSSHNAPLGELALTVLDEMQIPGRIFTLTDLVELNTYGFLSDNQIADALLEMSPLSQRQDKLVVCDLDDCLQMTSMHIKQTSSNFEASSFVYNDPRSLPSDCNEDVAHYLEIMRNDGYFIVVLTGRSKVLRAEISRILAVNSVPFDIVLCKDEGSFQNTPVMKSEAVHGLITMLEVKRAIFVDDNAEHLEGMLSGARKAGISADSVAFIVRHGVMESYQSIRKGVVLLCASPSTFRERALLERVASHFSAGLVNVDLVLDNDPLKDMRRKRNAAWAEIIYSMAVEKKRVVVFVTTGHAQKIKDLSAHVPAWTTLALLWPTTKCQLGVQWSLFHSISQKEEFEYRERYRGGTVRKNYLCPCSDLPKEEQTELTVEQHAKLSGVFRQLESDLKRCSETKQRLEGVHLRTIDPLVYVPLHHFWAVFEPDETISLVTSALRQGRAPPRRLDRERVCHTMKDMAYGRAHFGPRSPLQADPQRAFDEIVMKLVELFRKVFDD